MMQALNRARPVRDPGCKGIAPRPLRAVAGASIAPPPTYARRGGIVPLTAALRWKLTKDAMVMSAAKAHWKPMKSADKGKWSTADALLSIHTFKRESGSGSYFDSPGHQLVI